MIDDENDIRTPVTVLTGFLGSGKTTLLNRLVKKPEAGRLALVINEFGEIGIDHMLVEKVDENTMLLSSGCLCCTVRNDLVETLLKLDHAKRKGEASYDRVLIETTGLADPAPVLHTMVGDPMIAYRFRTESVVTCVDAVNGMETLDRHFESVKQVAVADCILLTKTDIADENQIDRTRQRVEELNPGVKLTAVVDGACDVADIIGTAMFSADAKPEQVRSWLAEEAAKAVEEQSHGHGHHHHHDVNRHDESVEAFCIEQAEPIEPAAFEEWINTVMMMKGPDLLRVKGLVNVAGEDAPYVINGVQHVFHPPFKLDAWPDDNHATRLVFITRDVSKDYLETMLETFRGPDRPKVRFA